MDSNKSINTTEYIKLIKESPEKKKSYVFIGVTFAVIILLIVFAIRPTILTITRINREIKNKKIVNTQLDNKIASLNKLDTQYAEIRHNLDDFALIYPADGNYSLFLSNIDTVASRNGFLLKSINFDEYDGDSYDINSLALMPWSVRLSVRGRRVNFINFLKDLEALPMYPVVESVSYNTQSDEDGLTSFSVLLRIYHIENNKFYSN
jgi:Tfp pilus assembly protein PilO